MLSKPQTIWHLRLILLIAISAFALFLRINQLNNLPPGMTDDEVRLAYSAYSLWQTGHDVTGKIFLPLSFVVSGFSFTPVSIYITAPFVGLLGLSPLSSRLPFALAGSAVVIIVYFLAKRLSGNQMIGLLSSFVLAANVWSITLSRVAYEMVFAQLFYLTGVTFFIFDAKKLTAKNLLFSMACFFLAFHSYNGTKLLLLPIIIILVWFRWSVLKYSIKQLLTILVIITGILISFGIISVYQKGTAHGGNFVIFQDTGAAADAVELERRASDAPQFAKKLYHNKGTYFLRQVANHYLYLFSMDFLFLNQEASGIFSVWSRGNFYLIELPLLLIGLTYLAKLKLRTFWFVTGMILLSPLPSALGVAPFTYATRSCFLLPWITILIGIGIYALIRQVQSKFWQKMAILLIGIVYAFYIGGYLNQYYYEWPRYGREYYGRTTKELLTFITSPENRNKSFQIAKMNDSILFNYAFYLRKDPKEVQAATASDGLLTSLDTITLLPACLTDKTTDPHSKIPNNTIYIATPECFAPKPDRIMPTPDGGNQFAIYF